MELRSSLDTRRSLFCLLGYKFIGAIHNFPNRYVRRLIIINAINSRKLRILCCYYKLLWTDTANKLQGNYRRYIIVRFIKQKKQVDINRESSRLDF